MSVGTSGAQQLLLSHLRPTSVEKPHRWDWVPRKRQTPEVFASSPTPRERLVSLTLESTHSPESKKET